MIFKIAYWIGYFASGIYKSFGKHAIQIVLLFAVAVTAWFITFSAVDRHMELYQECGYVYCPKDETK
jgi:hypothetical protein